MAKKDTRFTVAGITTHIGVLPNGSKVARTKVRYGTDMIRLIKMLNSDKKILDTKLNIALKPARVDLIDLPAPGMVKMDALTYMLSQPEFQSGDDQFIIQDEIDARTPKAPRVRKEKTVKVKRPKNSATLIQVLSAMTSTQPETV